jgi:uncharacterized protein
MDSNSLKQPAIPFTVMPFLKQPARSLIVWFLCACAAVLAAAQTPAKPGHFFNDYAGLVSPDVAYELNERLADAERRTSNQILVAIYPRLPEGVVLEAYTLKAFGAWGVGQAGKDNGLVLFIFLDGGDGHGVDRLEVGRGLGGAVPDSRAKWLLAEVLNPNLKRKAYELGMRSIVNQLLQLTAYEFSGDGRTQAERRARKADEDEDADAWLDKTFEGMLGVLWPMAWLMIIGVLAWKCLPWVLSGGEPGRRRGCGSRGCGGFWSGADPRRVAFGRRKQRQLRPQGVFRGGRFKLRRRQPFGRPNLRF